MIDWVLDCSFALAWGLRDEETSKADRLLSRVSQKSQFWVPALWWYEISNALTTARLRKRLLESQFSYVIGLYQDLPIQTDLSLGYDQVFRLFSIAQTYHLSAYDAAYLELAERKGIGLATLDHRLVQAAKLSGVQVFS
ncbi:MAG: type II toxin-antitoxin system VapC family toxin [Chlamydiae bacterium]|nr:type II toxin-antitoxin system VapC family toxin [Chlamydiota bacterium]MBI3276664.1 type II toxin-antitoxin system VapC family toxin [Chlamydiota bacterium]